MTNTLTDKLQKVTKAIEELPEERREALLDGLDQHVEECAASHMTDAHRAEVMRRLALPREHVPTTKINTILRRFNPAL